MLKLHASNASLPVFWSQSICGRAFRGLCQLAESATARRSGFGDIGFAFINRRGDRLKLLGWGRSRILDFGTSGLNREYFKKPKADNNPSQLEIDVTQLSLIINGIDLNSAHRRTRLSAGELKIEKTFRKNRPVLG